jgi:tRNA(Ile)-lysidine synthase
VHPLVEHVRDLLDRHRLWPESGPLVVAVSGGLDSVVLLALLRHLSPGAGVPLVVAHAHHGLRPEAEADWEFVAQLARNAELPFVAERLPVRADLAISRDSLEMTARRLRHAFLARAALAHGARRVALAHHAGDQAELFLLRLLRGSGGAGLGGMRPLSPSPADARVSLVRPLLDIPAAQMREFAAAEGIEHREDASNTDRSIPRNRVRHELLPLLRRDYSPAIDTLLLRTGELVGAEADFVHAEACRWRSAQRRKGFELLHPALQRAILREQLWELGEDADFELIERLRQHRSRVSTRPANTLRRTTEGEVVRETTATVCHSASAWPASLRAKTGSLTFDGVDIAWAKTHDSGSVLRQVKVPGRELFDAARVGTRIRLRHWQPGDRFQPLGLAKPAKVQGLLVNRKVPASRRRKLLIATTATDEIFWVEGLPPGERFKINPDTRRRLVWTWRRAD